MKRTLSVLAWSLVLPCLAQTNEHGVGQPACKVSKLIKGGVPTKPFERAAGESYKHAPIVSFTIEEDGSVTKVRLVRSSGIRDLDRQLLKAVAGWNYKPNPGCTIETKMSLIIDWN